MFSTAFELAADAQLCWLPSDLEHVASLNTSNEGLCKLYVKQMTEEFMFQRFCRDLCVVDFPGSEQNPSVKEFRKSVKIRQSYHEKFEAPFLGTQ